MSSVPYSLLCDTKCNNVTPNKFIPLQVHRFSPKHNRYQQPWSSDIAHAETSKRKWERFHRKSHLVIHKDLAHAHVLVIRSLVKVVKAETIRSKISYCSSSRELFAFYNSSTKTNKGNLSGHDDSQ